MTADATAVVLEGRPIGEVERLPDGTLRLRFHDVYRNDPTATPLSLSMPSADARHGDSRITPWLWGLLPDNADVLGRWGRHFGVSVASPYPLLRTPVGRDCAGAVQFCPPEELDELLGRSGDLVWLEERDVAARLRSLRADSTAWLGPGHTGQFSLGGAQAKTALHRRDGRWGVASGSTPTTHILKPTIAGFEDHHLNEHICMTAARTIGLAAAVTRIERFDDETAIVVERFDRTSRNDELLRIHQEDLCQALSVPPTRKYQSDGGPSPGQIAGLLRAAIPSPHAEVDLWRFADALAFNWLIVGTDAHAKNYALLLSGTQTRLSPLYDIASYLPYDDSRTHKAKLAMKIGDDYSIRHSDRRSAWGQTAGELGLDADRLIERVLDLAAQVPDAVARAAESDDITMLGSTLPHHLVDLVAKRCRRCTSALT